MGTLKIGNSTVKKIYRGSKEYKRVHCGSNLLYPAPFLLTRTRGEGSDIGTIRTFSYNSKATIGVLPSINEAPNGVEIYAGDILTITAYPQIGYRNPTVSVNGSEPASKITIKVEGDISVTSTAEIAKDWNTVYSGSLHIMKDTNGLEKTKTLTIEGLTPDLPTRISGTFSYKDNYGAEGEKSFENVELTKYFRCDGLVLDNPKLIVDGETFSSWVSGYTKVKVPTTANTLEYTYQHQSYAWVDVYITKIEQYY